MKPLLILKTGSTVAGLRKRRGDFEDWFRAGLGLGAREAPVVSVHRGEPLPPHADLSGVVVTGSPAMASEGADWSLAAERWLAEAVARELPTLAVCYGHHLLARALGGAADWNPQGREIGTVAIELTDAAREDPLFRGLPAPLLAQETHSQSVTALPPGARLLGRNAHDAHQAFALGTRAWSVQFHPEFDADIVRGYVDERAEDIAGEGLDLAAIRAAITEARDSEQLLPRFAAYCATN